MTSGMKTWAVVSDYGTVLGTYHAATNWAALRAWLADQGDKRSSSKRLAVVRVNDEIRLDDVVVREVA